MRGFVIPGWEFCLVRRRLLLALTGVVILLSAGQSVAQRRPVSSTEAQRVIDTWDSKLKDIDSLLVAGESKKAYRRVSALIGEITDRGISGTAIARFLGLATVLRALAAYQLGEEDEALWYWHIAAQMFPEVAGFTMNAYGDAGPFLKANPPRERNRSDVGAVLWGKDVRKPKKLKAPKPQMPRAKLGSKPVAIVVQTIIGEDGRVREPVILKSEGELTLVYVTLDALKDWRFEPAKRAGKPVSVFFNFTVNFQP